MLSWVLITAAAFGAGFVNSFAGGGSLLTFPALLFAGLPAVTANATSTVALWPGGVSGALGYRSTLKGQSKIIRVLAIPSAIGGLLGSYLLLHSGENTFRMVVPFLILFACGMLAMQSRLTGWMTRQLEGREHHSTKLLFLAQLLISIYGGYFGAGIGILMMATFAMFDLGELNVVIGLKNALNLFINGVAVAYFLLSGAVSYPQAGAMAVASILGGFTGAKFAQRLPARPVRFMVIGVGVTLALKFWFDTLHG